MKSDTGAQIRPTLALRSASGKPVMPAKVITGMPMDPKATGAVLANRQMPAAKNGSKPSPASIPAATATGAPNPAAPSMNAPKAKAIQEFLRSCPVFEEMLVRSGIYLIKYWFSVNDEEQERRFQERIENPIKRWKLSPMDVELRKRWVDVSKPRT